MKLSSKISNFLASIITSLPNTGVNSYAAIFAIVAVILGVAIIILKIKEK